MLEELIAGRRRGPARAPPRASRPRGPLRRAGRRTRGTATTPRRRRARRGHRGNSGRRWPATAPPRGRRPRRSSWTGPSGPRRRRWPPGSAGGSLGRPRYRRRQAPRAGDAQKPDGSGRSKPDGSRPRSTGRSHRLHRQEHAGHERGAVVGVVADGQALAHGAEETSWCATSPGRRTEWMRIPPGPSPPRAPATTSDAVRSAGHGSRPAARRASSRRSAVREGRARRGVELAVVMQLDDLDPVHERRRQLGEPHHEHGADGEVGGEHAVGRGATRTGPSSSPSVVLGDAGRPHHGVDPVRGAPPHVLDRRVGHREVDGHLGARRARGRSTSLGHLESGRVGAGHLAEIDPGQGRVDGGHQLELGILRRPPGTPLGPSGPRRRALPPASWSNPTERREPTCTSRPRSRPSGSKGPTTDRVRGSLGQLALPPRPRPRR